MVELKIGDSVSVEGHEYVVMVVNEIHDAQGRSANLHLKDPFIYQQTVDASAVEKQQQANVGQIGALLPKMAEHLAGGGEDHDG